MAKNKRNSRRSLIPKKAAAKARDSAGKRRKRELVAPRSGPARRIGPARYTPAVAFTDRQLLAVGTEPPFKDHQGTYEEPDVVIAGGEVPLLPQDVPCPGSLVIYSSWAEVVANCNGFAGPGAGNNAVVARALKNAKAVAALIPCDDGCQKTVAEIWRGWSCGGNPQPIVATGAVELKIECRITN
jgi:hypothetical protein